MPATIQPSAIRPAPTAPTDTSEICCPMFDPAPWDLVVREWTNKLFVRVRVPQVMHIPLGMPGRMTRLMERIEQAHAMPPADEALVLLQERSPWRADVLVAVTQEVPGLASERISGTFFTTVFDGPYRDTPKWIAETDKELAERGKRALRHLVRYAYCPRCAQKYGHNPGVVFAEIA